MKDNERAELEAIVGLAIEWCKDNRKSYLSLSVVDNLGSADVLTTDCDYKKLSVFVEGNK